MKKLIYGIVAMATVLALGCTSCKSGDDDDFEPLGPDDKVLVSPDVPAEGWSGNTDNGVLRYAPYEYDDEEPNAYLAFNMKDGVCDKAVVNIVMPSAAQAKQLAQMLNNGTWVDDDDDDDEYASARSIVRSRAFDMTNVLVRHLGSSNVSRAGFTLPIPVQQDGKVIYITMTNFKGLSADDIKTVIDLWSGYSMTVPDRVIFGTYTDGVYTCKNMHGMNIDYVVETAFNASGFCTKYTTRITLPSENWAQFYFEAFEDQIWEFEQQFGQRPELTIDGKTVVLDAVIIGDIAHDQIDAMIYALDWMNNCPFIYRLFGE